MYKDELNLERLKNILNNYHEIIDTGLNDLTSTGLSDQTLEGWYVLSLNHLAEAEKQIRMAERMLAKIDQKEGVHIES